MMDSIRALLRRPVTLGYIAVILAAMLEAIRQVLSKAFLVPNDVSLSDINPLTIAFIIFIVNGLFFSPFTRKSEPIRNIQRKDMFFVSLIGIAESAAMITYFFGLHYSTAINASVLNNGEILFSAILAIIIFREKLQRVEQIPFSLMIIGMIVIPVGYDFYTNGITMSKLVIGDILLLIAGLFWALDINMSNYVSNKLGTQRITQLASFVAGIFALSLILVFQIPFKIEITHIPVIAVIGIVSIGMSTALFITALKLIGAVRTILLYSINSGFGIIFAYVFLGEQVNITNIVAVSIAFIGLYFLRNRLAGKEAVTKIERPK